MGNSIKTPILRKAVNWAQGLLTWPSRSPILANQGENNQRRIVSFVGLYANWGQRDYIRNGFSENGDLYSVVNRIAKTAGSCPFKVYRVKDEKKLLKHKNWTGANATTESLQKAMMLKELVYEEDTKHDLNQLLDRPNNWQRGTDFTQNSVGFRLLTGNRFLHKSVVDLGANTGKIQALHNLPPVYMEILKGEGLFEVIAYQLNLGIPIRIEKEAILHSKYWNPNFDSAGSHLMGLSPLMAGGKNLTRSDAGLDRSTALLQNAGAAGMVFNKSIDQLTVEQAGQMKVKLNEEVLGVENAGKIAVANGDLGYLQFGQTAEQMDLVAQEKYSLEKICNLYNVPAGLFTSDHSAYNNVREWKKELITMAVVPELAALRDDWNEIALTYGEDIYVDYDLSVYPELQEDQEKTARIMQVSWWVKPNEKRIAMGLDEDPDEPMMDTYLVPSGMEPIASIGLGDFEEEEDLISTVRQNGNGVAAR